MVDEICENECESDGLSSTSSDGEGMRSPSVDDQSDRDAREFLKEGNDHIGNARSWEVHLTARFFDAISVTISGRTIWRGMC